MPHFSGRAGCNCPIFATIEFETMKGISSVLVFLISAVGLSAQQWQQRAEYTMSVSMDAATHRYTGKQSIVYFNRSPDALTKLYYHLYFNAFQPGSSMDVRSRWIEDPDARVGSRIASLTPDQQGYIYASNVRVNGKAVRFEENETILEVTLDQPIAPGGKATLELDFNGQVPLQIRRSGRNNAEGIDYSMSQWYPKLCEYDCRGWHPNPYIGREFYGVWGDFDVSITIDRKYVVAGTGILQNPTAFPGGYAPDGKVNIPDTDRLTWRFKAQNVHDFVWAADPDYVQYTAQVPGGPLLRFFYQNEPAYAGTWKDAGELVVKGFQFLSKNFGTYPYSEYSIIQGGDGGMEYPMATLITGNRKLPSLVGVTIHEAAHSWFQGVLATNESLYAWMDEGFTSYASNECMASLFAGRIPGDHSDAYFGYIELAKSGKEESLTTHADHFVTNYAYGTAAYNKGEVYLAQLGYIMGRDVLAKAMLRYWEAWKFKHPTALSFLHEMELESGHVLDWYHEYFVETTKTIDYAISAVRASEQKMVVTLQRKGAMPMPQEVEVLKKDGTKEMYYVPLDLMRGGKSGNGYNGKWTAMADWRWVDETYTFTLPLSMEQVESITIDPLEQMADIDRTNNAVTLQPGETYIMERK
jgi:hypothetical protein